MAEHKRSVKRTEGHLDGGLVYYTAPAEDGTEAAAWSAAVVGLGQAGLPTALALHGRCARIIGIDADPGRLGQIAARNPDQAGPDWPLLDLAMADGTLELTSDAALASEADAVFICVPARLGSDRTPDPTALRAACAAVVAAARPGQTIILTSTSYAGTTRELLAEPLAARGLTAGTDVFVAFSPEPADQGTPEQQRREMPRVAGGITKACGRQAAKVISHLTARVYLLSSPEVAEAAKLYENIFRAVSLALANEFADACAALDLDPVEVTLAAGAKSHGFPGAFPGPGVGGHGVPFAPHYLLWQLGKLNQPAPLIELAMRMNALRPGRVVDRAADMLAARGGDIAGAKVVVVGAAYRAGVADVAESPAIPIITGLVARGAAVSYYDPFVPILELPNGYEVRTLRQPRGADFDIAIVHTLHPGVGYSWVACVPQVLDATYEFGAAPDGAVV